MIRTMLSPAVTRIRLSASDAAEFEPVSFTENGAEYLRQSACVFTPRPVLRLQGPDSEGRILKTANGEVRAFDETEAVEVRSVYSVLLCFECAKESLLTGLGAHEDGIFDYARSSEYLYEHNMKIPVPFLLSSDGWGLLLEHGCAMKYRGEGASFTFELDAAEEVSYLVIKGKNCSEVLQALSEQVGKPAMLPKWAFGYIQSKERYESAEELLSVAEEFRKRGLGLDCIVQDWMTWRDGCWGDKTPDPARFPDVGAFQPFGPVHAGHCASRETGHASDT